MTTTTWGKLKPKDMIICPSSGREEQVTSINKSGHGRNRVFVRTTRHDHNRMKTEEVTLA